MPPPLSFGDMTLFDICTYIVYTIYCIFPSILQIFNFNCNCTMAIELVSNYFIVAVGTYKVLKNVGDYKRFDEI